jgi:hypothetical protein
LTAGAATEFDDTSPPVRGLNRFPIRLRFLQTVLNCVALALLLAAIAVAVALAPNIQTWGAQEFLAKGTGLHGSVDSVSAGFGKIEIGNLHAEYDGAVLNLPLLQASIPLTSSALSRSIRIRSLVATGWTLNLSRSPAPEAPQGPEAQPVLSASEQRATQAIAGLLGRWELPCNASVDAVELEGDVLVPAPPQTVPARLHVIVKGGGMGAGREGHFSFDIVDADPRLPVDTVSAHGSLTISMDDPRTIRRIAVKADLSTQGGSIPENVALAADASVSRSSDALEYTLRLTRAGRQVGQFVGRLPDSTGKLTGSWTVDVRDSDLAPFIPNESLPSFEATGDGQFDAETESSRIRAAGRIHAIASRMGVLSPPLEALGTTTLDSDFDFTVIGASIRFGRCAFALGGVRSVFAARALQPFEFDGKTGKLALGNPEGDWVEASATRLPLAWLQGLPGKCSFAGGKATGSFVVRPADGGFLVRPKGTLMASGVSVQCGGRAILRNADVSAVLRARYAPKGWEAQLAPLVISCSGRRLATFAAKLSQPSGEDQPIAAAGTWSADPAALASSAAIPGLGWIRGRSASGDFSATVGSWSVLDCKLAVSGTTQGTSLTADGHADIGIDGTVSLYIPIKIASGTSVSDLTAEGTWTGGAEEPRLDAKLTGGTVFLKHLGLVAGPVAAFGRRSPSFVAESEPDRIPFWGGSAGRVDVSFDQLKAVGRDFSEVTGRADFDGKSLRLRNVRGVLPPKNLAKLEGTISFDPAAGEPYSLTSQAEVSDIDASSLFADPRFGRAPALEGHFSAAVAITSSGANLQGLVAGAQEEYRLRSSGGIIRLLKTSVAEVIPEEPVRVSDELGKVGSAVGSFFGARRDSDRAGSNPVSKNAEAILDFTYAVSEIGYDEITVTATRGADRTIHLDQFTVTAPEERLTGTGEISYVAGLPLRNRPLGLDLVFAARGDTEGLLAKGGLLSQRKDDLGYSILDQPVHIGGSLAHFDTSQWHDLLAKAALRKPDEAKKGP